MELADLFAFADSYQPVQHQLPIKLQPFMPDYVPAIGAPHTFTAPPRPDGAADFLGLTVLDEPALRQSDPATLALQLRQQLKLANAGGGGAGSRGSAPPLGWVADPARQPHQLDAWIQQVEALHQADTSAAVMAPEPPDLENLMQAWTPDMQAHINSSPLPDPRQEVDLPTFARMVCNVLDLQPPPGSGAAGSTSGLAHCLHSLFALYLEFRHNPAFAHRAEVFGEAAGGGTVAEEAAGAAGAAPDGGGEWTAAAAAEGVEAA